MATDLAAEIVLLRAENEALKEQLAIYDTGGHLLLILVAFIVIIVMSVIVVLRREIFELWRQFDDTLANKPEKFNERSMRAHDIFNLLVLPFVVVLDVRFVLGGSMDVPENRRFWVFLWFTVGYIVLDMLWVILFPKCVKSQATIIVHHAVTLLYMCIPMYNPVTRYAMAVCLSVELNTWFLIMRRNPLTKKSAALKTIVKVFFYVSWYVIRIGLYPYMVYDVYGLFVAHSDGLKARGDPSWQRARYGGTYMAIPVVFQVTLTLLNVHWTIQLVKSNLAGKGPSKGL